MLKDIGTKINKIYPIFIFLITTYILYFKTIGSDTLEWGIYPYSELLIHYPDQFVRRGLLGEILLFFTNDNSAINTVQSFVFYNFVIFSFLVFYTSLKFSLNSAQISLVYVCSFGILNMVIYDYIFHRKEILVLNFFLFYLCFIRSARFRGSHILKLTYLLLTLVLTSLIHEGMLIIFTPFYFYILKKDNIGKIFNMSTYKVYMIVSIFLFALMALFKGDENISNNILNSLPSNDIFLLEPHQTHAINAIGWSIKRGLALTARLFLSGNVFYWSFVLILIFITLSFILFEFDLKKTYRYFLKNFTKRYEFLILPLIFVVGWDWGRWLITIFYLIFFTVLTDLERDKESTNHRKNLLPILIFLTLSILTIIPECCLSNTNPRILDVFEIYFFEIKFNY